MEFNGESNCPSPNMKNSESETCAICLELVTNRALCFPCIHAFCFPCLKKWTEQHFLCPLCRIRIEKIILNIRTDEDYDEYNLKFPSELLAFRWSPNHYSSPVTSNLEIFHGGLTNDSEWHHPHFPIQPSQSNQVESNVSSRTQELSQRTISPHSFYNLRSSQSNVFSPPYTIEHFTANPSAFTLTPISTLSQSRSKNANDSESASTGLAALTNSELSFESSTPNSINESTHIKLPSSNSNLLLNTSLVIKKCNNDSMQSNDSVTKFQEFANRRHKRQFESLLKHNLSQSSMSNTNSSVNAHLTSNKKIEPKDFDFSAANAHNLKRTSLIRRQQFGSDSFSFYPRISPENTPLLSHFSSDCVLPFHRDVISQQGETKSIRSSKSLCLDSVISSQHQSTNPNANNSGNSHSASNIHEEPTFSFKLSFPNFYNSNSIPLTRAEQFGISSSNGKIETELFRSSDAHISSKNVGTAGVSVSSNIQTESNSTFEFSAPIAHNLNKTPFSKEQYFGRERSRFFTRTSTEQKPLFSNYRNKYASQFRYNSNSNQTERRSIGSGRRLRINANRSRLSQSSNLSASNFDHFHLGSTIYSRPVFPFEFSLPNSHNSNRSQLTRAQQLGKENVSLFSTKNTKNMPSLLNAPNESDLQFHDDSICPKTETKRISSFEKPGSISNSPRLLKSSRNYEEPTFSFKFSLPNSYDSITKSKRFPSHLSNAIGSSNKQAETNFRFRPPNPSKMEVSSSKAEQMKRKHICSPDNNHKKFKASVQNSTNYDEVGIKFIFRKPTNSSSFFLKQLGRNN